MATILPRVLSFLKCLFRPSDSTIFDRFWRGIRWAARVNKPAFSALALALSVHAVLVKLIMPAGEGSFIFSCAENLSWTGLPMFRTLVFWLKSGKV